MSVMMMAPVMVMMTPVMVMVAPHVMMTPCVVVAVMPHLHRTAFVLNRDRRQWRRVRTHDAKAEAQHRSEKRHK
jgi:hypothetical protein